MKQLKIDIILTSPFNMRFWLGFNEGYNFFSILIEINNILAHNEIRNLHDILNETISR